MKQILLYVWQLPQHLLAQVIWGVLRQLKSVSMLERTKDNLLIIRMHPLEFGLSLGRYIFVHMTYGETTVKHEAGHSIQSAYLGPLYLLLIGLPSISRNIWSRLFHKKWLREKRLRWYYESWPEDHADRLGGVQRKF